MVYQSLFFIDLVPQVTQFYVMFSQSVIPTTALCLAELEQ